MDEPTIDDVRARSELLAAKYPDPAGDTALQAIVDDASSLVSAITGRDIGVEAGEEVPTNLVAVAKRAVTLKSEDLSVQGGSKARLKIINSGKLKSINAGPWGESYFGPGELAKQMVLDPDPALDEALKLLMTDTAWERFLEQELGIYAPASAVQSFDRRRYPGGYEGPSGSPFSRY